MKKTVIATSLLAALALPVSQAQAFEVSPENQKGGIATGSMVTGALAGGPIGAVIGLFAGQWLGEKVEDGERNRIALTEVEAELVQNHQRLDNLRVQLAEAERENARYAQAVFDQLQLELNFRTGVAELPEPSQKRLDYLAQFMINNPSIQLRLDGYADPRGDETYNQALSSKRVYWVAQQLIVRGVDKNRMQSFAHGERFSSANLGDIDGYALERVVKIELLDKSAAPSVVQK